MLLENAARESENCMCFYLRKSVYYHIGDYLGTDSAGNLNEGVCSIFDSVIIV